jgi:hypothetical protein
VYTAIKHEIKKVCILNERIQSAVNSQGKSQLQSMQNLLGLQLKQLLSAKNQLPQATSTNSPGVCNWESTTSSSTVDRAQNVPHQIPVFKQEIGYKWYFDIQLTSAILSNQLNAYKKKKKKKNLKKLRLCKNWDDITVLRL